MDKALFNLALHRPALTRAQKEARLRQRGCAIWLFGLPGAGKSTLATELERHLHDTGFIVLLLDSDRVRAGLNKDLGFDDSSRSENIRRVAEVAKLLVDAGLVVICAAITPLRVHRDLARSIIGDDFLPVYVAASLELCSRRDPKGLYRKARNGEIAFFTGIDSPFESPEADETVLRIDTESSPVDVSVSALLENVIPVLTRLTKDGAGLQ